MPQPRRPVEWMLRYGFIPESRTEKFLTIICADPTDVVKLLVSELVTNAVLHAKSEAEVVVQLRAECIRVEVLDRSRELPVVKDVPPDATSGRGMALVRSYASAWGTRSLPHGKAVWFEVPRSPSAH